MLRRRQHLWVRRTPACWQRNVEGYETLFFLAAQSDGWSFLDPGSLPALDAAPNLAYSETLLQLGQIASPTLEFFAFWEDLIRVTDALFATPSFGSGVLQPLNLLNQPT